MGRNFEINLSFSPFFLFSNINIHKNTVDNLAHIRTVHQQVNAVKTTSQVLNSVITFWWTSKYDRIAQLSPLAADSTCVAKKFFSSIIQLWFICCKLWMDKQTVAILEVVMRVKSVWKASRSVFLRAEICSGINIFFSMRGSYISSYRADQSISEVKQHLPRSVLGWVIVPSNIESRFSYVSTSMTVVTGDSLNRSDKQFHLRVSVSHCNSVRRSDSNGSV